MQLIRDHIHSKNSAAKRIALHIDRLQLAKRRWRAVAEDQTEFGFDLEHPLADGDEFFETPESVYVIHQTAEPVIDVPLPAEPIEAAKIGWLLGNLHFKIELLPGLIRINDDPAIRQLLHREHITHHLGHAAFHPISGGHSHSH